MSSLKVPKAYRHHGGPEGAQFYSLYRFSYIDAGKGNMALVSCQSFRRPRTSQCAAAIRTVGSGSVSSGCSAEAGSPPSRCAAQPVPATAQKRIAGSLSVAEMRGIMVLGDVPCRGKNRVVPRLRRGRIRRSLRMKDGPFASRRLGLTPQDRFRQDTGVFCFPHPAAERLTQPLQIGRVAGVASKAHDFVGISGDVVEFFDRAARAGKPIGPGRQRPRLPRRPEFTGDRDTVGIGREIVAVEPGEKVADISKLWITD